MTIELKIGEVYEETQIAKLGLKKVGLVGDRGEQRYDGDNKVFMNSLKLLILENKNGN